MINNNNNNNNNNNMDNNENNINNKKNKMNKSRPPASPPLVLLFSRLLRDLAASNLLLLPSGDKDYDDYYYF